MTQTCNSYIKDATMLLSHGNGIEMIKAAKIKRRGRWINGTDDDIYKFYGLKQQEESNGFQHLITCPDKRNDKYSTCGVHAEDVTIIEKKVKQSEHEQQHHSPKEARSEIHSLQSLIVVLDEKAQAEASRSTTTAAQDALPLLADMLPPPMEKS